MSAGLAAELKSKDIEEVREYIENFWPRLVRRNKQDLRTLIGLPNPYIVPCENDVFQEQYYWDSYPIVKALIDHPRYSKIAIGMVDNLLYLVKRFGIVPNASRHYFLSRSQPPLLSSMVRVVFEKTGDLQWYEEAIKLVNLEYDDVWMGRIPLRNYRLTPTGLSRYYDINALDGLAEAESGWDMTARFGGKCLNFNPVDLNCLLYLYEKDLTKAYQLLGKPKKAIRFEKLADRRADLVNRLMWNEQKGYYFDYNFVEGKQGEVITVAGVFPLSIGIASEDQARRVVDAIERILEKDYGIVQSEKFAKNYQWDYPNGWALMQLWVVEGLMRYGYVESAKRLIKKWLVLIIKVYEETGKLWEKYDVVNGKVGVPDRYPTQSGFGWTNATFILLAKHLENLEERQIYQDQYQHPDASWLTRLPIRF